MPRLPRRPSPSAPPTRSATTSTPCWIAVLLLTAAGLLTAGCPSGAPAPSTRTAVLDQHPLVEESAERLEERAEVEDRFRPLMESVGATSPEGWWRARTEAQEALARLREAQGLRHRTAGWCDPSVDSQEGCRSEPGDPDDPGGGGGDGDPHPCAWASAGPTNIAGRVQSLAVDPLDRDQVYAAAVGGLWRSSDGGRRWQRVTDDMAAGTWSAIAARGPRVVAARGDDNYNSGGAGIWTSLSAGAPGSWNDAAPPAPLATAVVHRLRLDPAGTTVYAATAAGLWQGDLTATPINWSRVGGMDADVDDFAVDWTATPPVIYAALRTAGSFAVGVQRWDGSSWSGRSDGLPTGDVNRIALALAASAPGTLYSRVVNAAGRQVGIYKTTTGGVPATGSPGWSAVTDAAPVDDALWGAGGNGYSWYVNVIEVDPDDPDRVYAGGVGLYRADDGQRFSRVSGGNDPDWPLWVHADQHTVVFDPVDSRIVWVGNDGGVDRSSDTDLAVWRWLDRAHGMTNTELNRIAGQPSVAGLRAGGSQDNGTEITFGNRTWYQPGGCDGSTAAVDGGSAVTLYANCNGNLYELANPVPGWMGGPTGVSWTSPRPPKDPLVADPNLAGRALASSDPVTGTGGAVTGPRILLQTTDGRTWTQANPGQPLASDQRITALAIAPSSSFATWYVALQGSAGPAVWRTDGGSGGPWNTSFSGFSSGRINDIEVDPTTVSHAYLALGGGSQPGVWRTTGGNTWTRLAGSGATAWPAGVAATALAIDPADPNVVYAATPGGVLRGSGTASPSGVAWTPFDDGLPAGVVMRDLWMNPDVGVLSGATYGHGAWWRDTSPEAECRERVLLVRDGIHDLGRGSTANGVPDPEHPIPDPARSGFFKPDDTGPGSLYWWQSTDIRMDVPSRAAPANTIASPDHVEVESCPVEMPTCPVGTVRDVNPVRGELARVHVQVSNSGVEPVRNVRVIALYANASAGLPLLPADFWSRTFPAGGGCGPLTAGSGWRLVDPSNPCRTVSVVNPQVPEVTRFDWNVPTGQAEHTCMLVVTESADDPIDPAVRSTGERRLWQLVPHHRQIANRNLHVIDLPAAPGGSSGGASGGGGWPRTVAEAPVLEISTAGLPPGTRVGLVLPPDVRPDGLVPEAWKGDPDLLPEARALELDTSTLWRLDGGERETRIYGLFSEPGRQVPFLLVWEDLVAPPESTWRITSREVSGDQVLGGQVWLLRLH